MTLFGNIVREACLIDGRWQGSKWIKVCNPSHGEVVGRVPQLGGAETREAIDAANTAMPAWQVRTASDRASAMLRLHDLMQTNIEPLAALLTAEQGQALAVRFAVVLKPSEQTPFTALAIAALAEEAGLPPRLLNAVTGDPVEIGGEMTGNPQVAKISFTGSTRTGAALMTQSASTIKKLSLELGGNAPFVLFDDADLDAAVAGAIQSKFRNAGQTCVSVNRFYAQAGIHDAFAERLPQRQPRWRRELRSSLAVGGIGWAGAFSRP